MRTKIICIIVIIFCFSSCYTFSPKKELIPFDTDHKEIVLSTDNEKNVWGLYLKIIGETNGEVKIEIERDDSNHVYEIIVSKENNQHLLFNNNDYYSNKIYVRIYPINNSNGKIEIQYYFCLL